MHEDRLRDAILRLLAARGAASSICPSEAARAVAADAWRALMPAVREAARDLARHGAIEITQRGSVLSPDGPLKGALRLRLPRLRAAR